MTQLTVKYMCHQVANSLLTDIIATDGEHYIRDCPLPSMMYIHIWIHLWKVMSPQMTGLLSLCAVKAIVSSISFHRATGMMDMPGHLAQMQLRCRSNIACYRIQRDFKLF